MTNQPKPRPNYEARGVIMMILGVLGFWIVSAAFGGSIEEGAGAWVATPFGLLSLGGFIVFLIGRFQK